MAGQTLVDAVNSVLERLGNIPYDWGSVAKAHQDKLFQYVAIFNDQINRSEDGEGSPLYDTPACFVDVEPAAYVRLLGELSTSDLTYRIRIMDKQFDASDGTLDQNLQIFGFRNLVKESLSNFVPANSSMLQHTSEMQDPDHTAVYIWQMEFKSAFIDTIGSIYSPINDNVIDYVGADIELVVNPIFRSDTNLQDEAYNILTDETGLTLTL